MYYILVTSLVKIFNEGAYLNKVVSNEIENKDFSIYEKKIFTKIIYGVVENKILLDYYLQPFVKGKRIKPFIRNTLRIGAYAITFMELANHFIVDKMVEVVKKQDYNGSKFVNAVLRNYERTKLRTFDGLSKLEYISVYYSIPQELVNYLAKIYNNLETILEASLKNSNTNSYRINYLKVKEQNLILSELNNYKYQRLDNMIFSLESLIHTKLFQEGYLIAQDYSSTMPVVTLSPRPNETVLDACSAPGMKTVQMAELMQNKGKIIALDVHEHKIKLIQENASRLGAEIINPILSDASTVNFDNLLFDKILVDAPCSGLGVISHKPDLKYRMTVEKINEIAKLDYEILCNCSKYLKLEGNLVYSTCTITKIENQDVINKFLKEHINFILCSEKMILPGDNFHHNDGFYICKLKKIKGEV